MKIQHLRKPSDFRKILREGQKIKAEKLSGVFRTYPSKGPVVVGVTIPKKAEPLATKRNYLRRIIYCICSEQAKKIKKRTEIVIRLDRTLSLPRGKTYEKVKEELESLFQKNRAKEEKDEGREGKNGI